MQPVEPDELRVDRTALEVGSLDDEDPVVEYWLAASVEDRLRYLELLRRLNYGRRAAGRLQRVLSVTRF